MKPSITVLSFSGLSGSSHLSLEPELEVKYLLKAVIRIRSNPNRSGRIQTFDTVY
jgi:hypothetical protein